MVIRMTDSSNKKTTSTQQNQSQLRRTKMRHNSQTCLNGTKNTKAEFNAISISEALYSNSILALEVDDLILLAY